MKPEDLFLRVATKVQQRLQMEVHALENTHASWQDVNIAQQRLRTATMLVNIVQDVINENIGDTE